MKRFRFHCNVDDPRPVNWPVKHPYWITGEGEDYAVVVSYGDDEKYIIENWPDATEIEGDKSDEYFFSDRFPRPEWFKEVAP